MRLCSIAHDPRWASERKYTFFILSKLKIEQFKISEANQFKIEQFKIGKADQFKTQNSKFKTRLIKPQLYACLFGHHTLIPFGFENEVDGRRLDVIERVNLQSHVLKNEVGGGARRRCECHVDVYVSVVIDVYLVYKSEIVYVDGYFGVVNGLQDIDDALLYLCLLFLCHLQ